LGGDAPPCRRQARQRLARQSIPLGSWWYIIRFLRIDATLGETIDW
jgi:hypothetical protein